MSTARTWVRRRRTTLIAIAIVAVAFIAAIALWAGGGEGDESLPAPPTSDPSTSVPGAEGTTAGATPTSTSGSSGSGTLPTLPGFGGSRLPDQTDLTTLGPGNHRVVMTARSDQPMLAVGYAVKGDTKTRTVSGVKSPVVIARTIPGQGPLATIALQLGPTAQGGSCSITIDGKVVSTQRATKPYAVAQCVG